METPLIGTVSFVLLYSETGIVPRALHALLGIDPASTAISGIAGVLVVHTFTMYPFFYLSVTAGLAGLDSSLESAAANLGAGKLKTWATVILPMLTLEELLDPSRHTGLSEQLAHETVARAEHALAGR